MAEMASDLDQPTDAVVKIMSKIRKKLGRNAVEANAKETVINSGNLLGRFYSRTRVPLEVKRSVEGEVNGKKVKKTETVMEEKDIVFVHDLSAFVLFIIAERGLDPSKCVVRVGIDSGRGSLKFVVSIYDIETEVSSFEDENNDDDNDEDINDHKSLPNAKTSSAQAKKLNSGRHMSQ